MRIRRFLIFGWIAWLSVSCKPETSSVEGLINYTLNPDNGLMKEREVRNTKIQVVYRPKDIIVAQHVDANKPIVKQIDSLKMALHEFDYFVIRISKAKQDVLNYYANTDQYERAVNYINYDMGRDIRVICNQDTISAFDFIYMRAGSTAAASDVLVAFKSNLSEKKGLCQVMINDKFFDSGLNTFEFNLTDIKSTPSLDPNLLQP